MSTTRKTWIKAGVIAAGALLIATLLILWIVSAQRVYVDTASVQATQITLGPSHAGILEEVYVHEGDEVQKDTAVARVGNELLKAKVSGVVLSVSKNIGSQANPNESVVTMIDPTELRIVGQIDEDKGFNRVAVGNPVTFTVDAFGSKEFSGVIDEISETSRQSGIVFNISDKREVKQFEVKARFDVQANPGLKNGMSARMWIYSR